ncbi:hypothetical protein E2C01_008744 [Portunus trituberculatus]|uniref:Uncharacterized protein n=1 Tax=Portunus trituberculatus TaxID=210409 RepID=A0A5B7D2S2_PORTR|nr:hypothetical protein [Portunus trituberculatus]
MRNAARRGDPPALQPSSLPLPSATCHSSLLPIHFPATTPPPPHLNPYILLETSYITYKANLTASGISVYQTHLFSTCK